VVSRLPQLVLRPQHDEFHLLAEHPELYEAALLKDSYLAPYSEDDRRKGEDPERLARAVAPDREVWRDPDTAGLVSRTSARLPIGSRRREMPIVRQFGLPLDLRILARGSWKLAVDLTLEAQAGAATRTPPYFDFGSRRSTALQLNLAMVRRTVAAVGDEVPTAVIQVSRHRLMTGLLAAVAGDYATTGAQRALLRVRGFDAERASREELTAYLDAAAAYRRRGIEVLPDCVGLLGPVFVADGAAGFATGTRFFRRVPGVLLSMPGGGGGEAIRELDPDTWEERPRDVNVQASDARLGFLRTLHASSALAATEPDEFIEALLGRGGYPAIWAGVLADRKRRAA
jgi:hypothetical protein